MPDRADVVANLSTAVDSYEQGQEVVISAQFSDPMSTTPPLDPVTGFEIVTPTTATCVLRAPDGTQSAPSVTKTGTVYSASFIASEDGTYWYGFKAAGSYVGYAEAAVAISAAQA